MSSTGWSPLPFALRYAQLARKKQQELELQMSQDIIELFQRSTQTINYPETAIPTLPIIREQKHKLNKKRQLFPPPPESGLHAYTQVLWPPDRKRRKSFHVFSEQCTTARSKQRVSLHKKLTVSH